MKKSTKRLLGGIALAAAGLSALGAVVMKKNSKTLGGRSRNRGAADTWARPGMTVTFRAELMPGRETAERTFRVTNFLPSGRVLLSGVSGEHAEREFERIK